MTSSWRATVLTIFPEMFPGPLGSSLAGKALADGKWALEIIDIRDFATDKHRSVDDTPAGGGAGMVMRADIAAAAIDAARAAATGLFATRTGAKLYNDLPSAIGSAVPPGSSLFLRSQVVSRPTPFTSMGPRGSNTKLSPSAPLTASET